MGLSNLQSLIGKWVSDRTESGGQKATIYFGRDGRLVYLLHGSTQDEARGADL